MTTRSSSRMPLLLIFRFVAPDTLLFYICAFVDGMFKMMIFDPCFATVQDLVPIRVRSTIVAFLLFSINFLGVAPGGYVCGALCDLDRMHAKEAALAE